MSQREFTHLLQSLEALSPDQLAALRRELDSRLEPPPGTAAAESVYDVMARAGVIGCIKGRPHASADLSTNPKHMEGFGSG